MPRYSTSRSRSVSNRKKRYSTKSRSRNSRMRGGGVVLPSEYFGKQSGAYVEQCGPVPFSTAYGEAVPRSFGTLNTSLGPHFAAPQLAPGGLTSGTMTSGIQTGGGVRRRRRGKRKTSRTLKQKRTLLRKRNSKRSRTYRRR